MIFAFYTISRAAPYITFEFLSMVYLKKVSNMVKSLFLWKKNKIWLQLRAADKKYCAFVDIIDCLDPNK